MLNRALVIREPWITSILDGRKTWEMRSKETRIRGTIGLARRGSGLIVGVADLIDSLPALRRESYMDHQTKHAIPSSMLDEVITAGWVHPWVLSNVVRLAQPVRYVHKSGAVTFVVLDESTVGTVTAQLREQNSPTPLSSSLPALSEDVEAHRRGPVRPKASETQKPRTETMPSSKLEPASESDLFVFRPQEAQAYGRPMPSGKFLVLRGSTAMLYGSPRVKRDDREDLVNKGVLEPDSDERLLRFTRDYLFSSASKAAGIVKDGNASGPQLWKHHTLGVSLKDYLASKLD